MSSSVRLDKTWRFIHSVDKAVGDDAIATALHHVAEPFGLTSIFGGIVPTAQTAPKHIATRILLQRFPAEWAERYNELGYVFRDPIVERLQGDQRPFSWHDAYGSSHIPANVALIQGEASEFGLREGFVVPVALLDGNVAAVSYGGPHPDLSPDDQALLGFVSNYAVGQLLQRRQSAEQARGRVTAREYDCLLWSAEGRTELDISLILGISKSTVTKHIQSAREKLGAMTKTHAVAIAMREKFLR